MRSIILSVLASMTIMGASAQKFGPKPRAPPPMKMRMPNRANNFKFDAGASSKKEKKMPTMKKTKPIEGTDRSRAADSCFDT